MQPEQQQRIMGYFIEEAKEHLDTIEQGLLKLQTTIGDSEMSNELFRAAHSVKGGAAMLGLNSIQRVAHRLEDFFKILKETPLTVDQKLESLFLRVFDALKELLDQLQNRSGVPEQAGIATVTAIEPTFVELEQHLQVLASNSPAQPVAAAPARTESAQSLIFKNEIPVRLREMLQLFKQPETDTATREQLQAICRSFGSVGEQFHLPNWCSLVDLARQAIAQADHSYRVLAPIVIRDIKQAQDLVIAGREAEVCPGLQLRELVPAPVNVVLEDDFTDLLETADEPTFVIEPEPLVTSTEALFGDEISLEPIADPIAEPVAIEDSFDLTAALNDTDSDQHGPEVGMAELNSLADLFEGEVPDLGSTWQQEEVISRDSSDLLEDGSSNSSDTANDFADLLFEETASPARSAAPEVDLNDLFDDELVEPDPAIAALESDDLGDFFALPSGVAEPSQPSTLPLSDLFGSELNGTIDFSSADFSSTDFNAAAEPDLNSTSNSAPALDNLGELFAGLDETDLSLTAPAPEAAFLEFDSSSNSSGGLTLDDSDPWDSDSLQISDIPLIQADDLATEPSTNGAGLDDLFVDDLDATGAIEELSDQGDLDFSDLLEPIAPRPTDTPLTLEALSDDDDLSTDWLMDASIESPPTTAAIADPWEVDAPLSPVLSSRKPSDKPIAAPPVTGLESNDLEAEELLLDDTDDRDLMSDLMSLGEESVSSTADAAPEIRLQELTLSDSDDLTLDLDNLGLDEVTVDDQDPTDDFGLDGLDRLDGLDGLELSEAPIAPSVEAITDPWGDRTVPEAPSITAEAFDEGSLTSDLWAMGSGASEPSADLIADPFDRGLDLETPSPTIASTDLADLFDQDQGLDLEMPEPTIAADEIGEGLEPNSAALPAIDLSDDFLHGLNGPDATDDDLTLSDDRLDLNLATGSPSAESDLLLQDDRELDELGGLGELEMGALETLELAPLLNADEDDLFGLDNPFRLDETAMPIALSDEDDLLELDVLDLSTSPDTIAPSPDASNPDASSPDVSSPDTSSSEPLSELDLSPTDILQPDLALDADLIGFDFPELEELTQGSTIDPTPDSLNLNDAAIGTAEESLGFDDGFGLGTIDPVETDPTADLFAEPDSDLSDDLFGLDDPIAASEAVLKDDSFETALAPEDAAVGQDSLEDNLFAQPAFAVEPSGLNDDLFGLDTSEPITANSIEDDLFGDPAPITAAESLDDDLFGLDTPESIVANSTENDLFGDPTPIVQAESLDEDLFGLNTPEPIVANSIEDDLFGDPTPIVQAESLDEDLFGLNTSEPIAANSTENNLFGDSEPITAAESLDDDLFGLDTSESIAANSTENNLFGDSEPITAAESLDDDLFGLDTSEPIAANSIEDDLFGDPAPIVANSTEDDLFGLDTSEPIAANSIEDDLFGDPAPIVANSTEDDLFGLNLSEPVTAELLDDLFSFDAPPSGVSSEQTPQQSLPLNDLFGDPEPIAANSTQDDLFSLDAPEPAAAASLDDDLFGLDTPSSASLPEQGLSLEDDLFGQPAATAENLVAEDLDLNDDLFGLDTPELAITESPDADPFGFDVPEASTALPLEQSLAEDDLFEQPAATAESLDLNDDLFGLDTPAPTAATADAESLDFDNDLFGSPANPERLEDDFGLDLESIAASSAEDLELDTPDSLTFDRSRSDDDLLEVNFDDFDLEPSSIAANSAASSAELSFEDDLFGDAELHAATRDRASDDDLFGLEDNEFDSEDNLFESVSASPDQASQNAIGSAAVGEPETLDNFDQFLHDTPTATPETDFGDLDRLLDDRLLDDASLTGLEDVSSAQSLEADFDDLDSLLSDASMTGLEDTTPAAETDFGLDHLLGDASTGLEDSDRRSIAAPADDDFADLDDLLNLEARPSNATRDDEFADLDSLLQDAPTSTDDFADLDDLLGSDAALAAAAGVGAIGLGAMFVGASDLTDDFSDLDALLQAGPDPTESVLPSIVSGMPVSDAEFDELDDLLKDAEEKMGGSPTVKSSRGASQQNRRAVRPGRVFGEQTMRVPVKHLDNLSNLVGELVVNRNSLEQDQERLRQSLDNLLYQVQQLSDVGQRMQDLYERSLLESSLLAGRQSRLSIASNSYRDSSSQTAGPTGVEYDPLEMDRFTGFHSLSQEMIELIVRVRESASDIEFIVDETDQVTRMFRQVTTQLQEGLTRSRMVPFAQTADRLPRAVRDISMKVGKQAELIIEGRETLIDKMILEQLYDPMTHLVNNALTHGIESPEVRRAAGKPAAGRIAIRAFHQGNQTIISVSDDGAGIDVERVKRKAIEKRLVTPAEARSMSRLDVYDLLFHAGFSTKDQADDFSGRGVGMDVVRTSLSEIRGAVTTDSTSGKGTTFTIRLPLTLSISKALCCISDRARIAFPMDGVEDMLDLPKERIQSSADGHPQISWRDSILPVRPLAELLGYNRHLSRGNVYGGNQEDDIVSIVVLRSAGNFLALQVDQVLGEQEIVIKQLEGPVPKPVGVAGATVLGDGRIMPIADVLELIDLSMGRIRKDAGGSLWDQGAVPAPPEPAKTEPTVLIVDDSITVRELLSMTFNKVGYRVEQARDGQEAWEKLRSGLPCDIVFCDIEMPRMDGLELLSRIQKDPNLNHLPIAMLTSRGADRHRQMAASLGASGYFTKPYLEEGLLDAAQRMLKGEVLLSPGNG